MIRTLLPFAVCAMLSAAPKVELLRLADGARQPQVAVDRHGTVHLIYLTGDAGGSDVYYTRINGREFAKPIRVNSVPASAIAAGTVRGPQIAIGGDGRVHVAWMGSKDATPKGPDGATPMLYTRLNDAGTAFEPQRNVMQFAVGLDGGTSVAANAKGEVFVVWHGSDPPLKGEENRRVWVAHSSDGGKTFAREVPAYPEKTGACACCGMRAFADRKGEVYMLYRTATEAVHRDMFLLYSKDGNRFDGSRIHKWELNACPMSTESIAEDRDGVVLAWETANQVYFGKAQPGKAAVAGAIAAPGEGKRKHPAVAVDPAGDTILVWTEGTGWNKGGSLAWQIYGSDGKPRGEKGEAPGVPAFSMAAVFPRGGGFTIVY